MIGTNKYKRSTNGLWPLLIFIFNKVKRQVHIGSFNFLLRKLQSHQEIIKLTKKQRTACESIGTDFSVSTLYIFLLLQKK